MRLATATLAAVLALALAQSRPALAWDPFASDPGDPDAGASFADPAPLVIPDGLYIVTDVYAGDVVTSTGSTTTYATATTPDTPGTWARVMETVGTGQASANDGASLNGRAALPDGRSVAGTYYQDFVLTGDGFVPVNIVFFQDDSVTIAPAPPPQPPATPPAPAAAPAAAAPPAPAGAPLPGLAPLPATPAPPVSPAPPVTPAPPVPPPPADPPAARLATAGVALGETARPLGSIEVLRGRRVALWPRAFLDGVPVAVRSWRLVSGSVDLADPLTGTGAVPCDATWLALTPVSSAWTLRFEVTSDVLPGRVLTATIDVVVRSPALEQ